MFCKQTHNSKIPKYKTTHTHTHNRFRRFKRTARQSTERSKRASAATSSGTHVQGLARAAACTRQTRWRLQLKRWGCRSQGRLLHQQTRKRNGTSARTLDLPCKSHFCLSASNWMRLHLRVCASACMSLNLLLRLLPLASISLINQNATAMLILYHAGVDCDVPF